MTSVQLSIALNTSAAVLNANALVAAIRPLITLSPRAAGAVGSLGKSIAKLGTGSGAGLILDKVAQGTLDVTRVALETADQLDLLSKKTGIGAEQLQRFQIVAARRGISADKLSEAISFFNASIGRALLGDESALSIFSEFGLFLVDLKAGADDLEKILLRVLDSVSGIATSSERSAAGQILFGKKIGADFAAGLASPREKLEQELAAVSEAAIIPAEQVGQGATADRLLDSRQLEFQRALASGNLQFGAEAIGDLTVTLGDPAFLRGVERLGQASGILVNLGASGADIVLQGVAPALEATLEVMDALPETISEAAREFVGVADAILRENERIRVETLGAIEEVFDQIGNELDNIGARSRALDARQGVFLRAPDDGNRIIRGGFGEDALSGGVGDDLLFASSTSRSIVADPLLRPELTGDSIPGAEQRFALLQQEVTAITEGGLPALEALEQQRRRAGEVASFREALAAETAGMTDQAQVVDRLTARYGGLAEARDQALEQIAQQEAAESRLARSIRQLGFTFSSAFEDAVIEGRDLSDVLKSLGDDIQRVLLRTLVTEPLFGGLADVLGGGAGQGLFGSLFGGTGSALVPGSAETAAVGPLSTAFGFRRGGLVRGPGTATSDSLLARLSAGEFVVNGESTRSFLPLLQAINDNSLPAFRAGGLARGPSGPTARFDLCGLTKLGGLSQNDVRPRPGPARPAPVNGGFTADDSRHLADLARTARMQRHQMMLPRKRIQIAAGSRPSQRQMIAQVRELLR